MKFLDFQIPDSLFCEAVGIIPSMIVEESLEGNLMSVVERALLSPLREEIELMVF